MLLFSSGNSFAQGSISPITTVKNDGETIYKQSEVDQKAKVTKRSYPSTDGKCTNDEGLVRALVVLHKSGKVGDVKFLISSECQRFNENSLASAKKLNSNRR
jgi:outer membrane biosynthesis protein TonB